MEEAARLYPGKSAYAMQPVDTCVAEVLRQVRGPLPTSRVALAQALGCVLAEDVSASAPIPAFPTSIMDGFAVCSSDGPGRFPVDFLEGSTAGNPVRTRLPQGKVRYITTGAPLPEGADAVVTVENSKEVREGGQLYIEISVNSKPNANVRKVGSDTPAGEVVLRKGSRIGAGEIGVLAALGHAEVVVCRRPRVAIVSTGDELVDVTAAGTKDEARGQVVDCNRPMLRALVEEAGAEAVDFGIIPDDEGAIQKTFADALATADVVVSSGAASHGSKDYVKPLLGKLGTVHFGSMLMKPGKPTTFATVPAPGSADQPRMVFALPGNPVSCFVTFKLIVVPALEQLRGNGGAAIYPRVDAELLDNVEMDPVRPEYHRAVARWEGNRIVATSTGFQRSSRIASVASANCFLEIPKQAGVLPKGTVVKALLLPGGLSAAGDGYPVMPPPALASAAAIQAASKAATKDSGATPSGRSTGPWKIGLVGVGSEGAAAVQSLRTFWQGKAPDSVVVDTCQVQGGAEQLCQVLGQWSNVSDADSKPEYCMVLVAGSFSLSSSSVGKSVSDQLRAMLAKEAPNVTDAMLRAGLPRFPLLMLEDLVAGFRNGCLLATVPATAAATCAEAALWPLLGSEALREAVGGA